MRAYKFGQKWEIGQKSPASTCLRKTDAANPIKPFKTSRNQRFRKFWSLLLRMPEAGPFAIRVALAVGLGRRWYCVRRVAEPAARHEGTGGPVPTGRAAG